MDFQQNEYDLEIQKMKAKRKVGFAIAKVLQGVFYFAKILLKLLIDILKGVLRTLGLPIGR